MWLRHVASAGGECVHRSTVCDESRVRPLVDPAELRWTHDKIQRLFTCGRRVGDVVTDSCRGGLRPSELRMIEKSIG